MKIATWNIERLRHKNELEEVLSRCDGIRADILVLTETDRRASPHFKYCFSTPAVDGTQSVQYKATENRVSIYTNYRCLRQYPTFDKYTSICVELETERGELLVYGTIVGIYGNRHPSFSQDLNSQLADIERLSHAAKGFCFCGDLNCSFADNYYFTNAGREALIRSFNQTGMVLLTADQAECIDHIAISSHFVKNAGIQIQEWNQDKHLSDHKGVAVTLIC